jgi:SAM-dependent methyltransferase
MGEKESFAEVYEATEAGSYYRAYAPTRLSIVEYAATLVRTAVDLGCDGPVLDLGCGYGTLGLLLRTELGISEAYGEYLAGRAPRAPNGPHVPTIVGFDRSATAPAAALRDGLLDRFEVIDLNALPPGTSEHGADAIVVCTAVLGYVHPRALRAVLDRLRPRIAIVTCVTWLMPEFLEALGEECTVAKLNRLPLFQRWATPGEELRMPNALVEGAHRAECFLLSREPLPVASFRAELERVRRQRADDRWLAAGRSGGCELPGPRRSNASDVNR